MFENGLVIDLDKFTDFLNDKLLGYMWQRFTDDSDSMSIKELRPMMHESIVEFGIESMILNLY